MRTTAPVQIAPQQLAGARDCSASRGAQDLNDIDVDGDGQDSDASNYVDGDSEGTDSSPDPSSDSDGNGGGGGGGGGGSPPGSQGDNNSERTTSSKAGAVDMDWWIEEADCYRDKDLQTLQVPDIPHDAAGSRTFWNNLKTQMSSIDRSAEDHFTAWVDIPKSMLAHLSQVINQLDANSQGVTRLDR